jgi:hypothetical protein
VDSSLRVGEKAPSVTLLTYLSDKRNILVHKEEHTMALTNPWLCVLYVSLAGALGGLVNAFRSDNGFVLPTRIKGVWCPGALWNVLLGSICALTSWALYGSGAGIDAVGSQREQISLKFGALAGALIVGVAGARWLTSEVDKTLMRQTVLEVAKKHLPEEVCDDLEECDSPRKMLKTVIAA